MRTLFSKIPMLLMALVTLVGGLVDAGGRHLTKWQTSPFFKPALACVLMATAVVLDARAFLAAPVVFGILTEGMHVGEFLVSELPGTLSREKVTVTVPASTTLQSGFVLGRLTSGGKYVPYDNAGGDGSETAAAILWNELVNDTVAPVDMTAAVIRDWAEVSIDDLVWATGLVDADKTAGLADLATRGIKGRASS